MQTEPGAQLPTLLPSRTPLRHWHISCGALESAELPWEDDVEAFTYSLIETCTTHRELLDAHPPEASGVKAEARAAMEVAEERIALYAVFCRRSKFVVV